MKKELLIKTLLLAFLLSTTSCTFENDIVTENQTPENFKELIANDFDWSTVKNYTIIFQGIDISSDIKKPLTIKADGNVISNVFMSIKENKNINIEVPIYVNTITISWGTIQKEIQLNNNNQNNEILFSFLN